jgi:DNA-directed RNA polymerase subunit E'/Rpb7
MTSTDLFIPIKFKTSITLKPSELDENFEKTILKKLKDNYENVCSKYGYIKNNSIKIKSRSIGLIKNQHFNGNTTFDVICLAEICNPIQGSIIKCKVKAKNSMGLLASGYYDKIPILEIIIPKISAGIQSEVNLDNIVIGQEIKIEVCGKKYQLFDKHISIIGKAIRNKEEVIKNAIIEDAIIDDIDNEPEEEEVFDEINVIEDEDKKEDDENEEDDDEDDDEDDEEEEKEEDEDDLSNGGGDEFDELDEFEGGVGDYDDYD